MAEHQLEDENDWVVVRKQKITILVPPASPFQSKIRSFRGKQLQNMSKKKVGSRSHNSTKRFAECSKHEEERPSGNCSLHEAQNHQDKLPALRMQQATYPPNPNGGILASPSIKSKGTCSHTIGESELQQCSRARVVDVVHSAVSSRDQFFSTSRFSETVGDGQRLLVGALPVVNQRIRASNLEKRLEGLGGLKRYLVSLGLNQFIQIFEREKIDKFQLVNLTMHKLKDMGADAVGPRRKLLYAIDCLCQPYLKVSQEYPVLFEKEPCQNLLKPGPIQSVPKQRCSL